MIHGKGLHVIDMASLANTWSVISLVSSCLTSTRIQKLKELTMGELPVTETMYGSRCVAGIRIQTLKYLSMGELPIAETMYDGRCLAGIRIDTKIPEYGRTSHRRNYVW